MNDLPAFYVYEAKDGWMKTDKRLTQDLNRMAFGGIKCATNGYSFYPQWGKPDYLNETKIAWRITADGERVARWYWCEREHNRSHGNTCKLTEHGKCITQCLCRLQWDNAKQFWTLCEMKGRAENIN